MQTTKAMKKLISLGLFLMAGILLFAAEDPSITSTIKRVTVFRKGAQVSREATASVAAGTSVLKFVNIAPDIDKQSIQLKADGDFTVLSVIHQINYFEEPEKSATIQSLFDRQEELLAKMEEQLVLQEVYQEEEALILANKSIGGQENGVQISELSATAAFYRSRLMEVKLEKLEVERSLKKLQKEAEKINAQLDELNAEVGTYTSEVWVTVNATAATAGEFLLSYVVSNAGWFPNYDIRVKDVQSPANLAYKANVFQTSGEDWNDVLLTLSTGDPAQSGTKPELEPWYLRFYVPNYSYGNGLRKDAGVYYGLSNGQARTVEGRVVDEIGEALIGVSILVRGTSVGTVTDIDGKYSLTIPAGAQSLIYSYTGFETLETAINPGTMNIVLGEGVVLDEVVVTSGSVSKFRSRRKEKKRFSPNDYESSQLAPSQAVPVEKQEKTTTTEFKINLPYSIKSDGQQATVAIKKEEIPAFYQYYCVPKIDLDAFLTAQITDWENYDLLSGEINLFFEGTYLGKSYLDVGSLDDTLHISLGRDKNIVVERTQQKEFSKKQFIGNKRTDTRAWEIEVRNKKKQPINLVVEDQFPLSTNNDIEVSQEAYDGASLDETTGKLVWRMELGPSASKKMNFKYAVKYPKKQRLQLE